MTYTITCDWCYGSRYDEDDVPCMPCNGEGVLCGQCDLPVTECACPEEEAHTTE